MRKNILSNIRVSKYGNPQNPSHVYYNCDIIDSKTEDDGVNPPISFEEKRTTNIIEDVSKYYFSIIRFSLNGPNILLPMFVPSIEKYDPTPIPGITDEDKKDFTTYYFGVAFETYPQLNEIKSSQIYTPTAHRVIFKSQFPSVKSQTPVPNNGPYLNNEYYYVRDYQHVVDNFNEQLVYYFKSLPNTITLSDPTGTGPDLTLNLAFETNKKYIPKIIYNENTKLFSILYNTELWGENASGIATVEAGFRVKAHLYMNSNLWGLFNSFPHEDEGGDLSTINVKGVDNYAYRLTVPFQSGNSDIVKYPQLPILYTSNSIEYNDYLKVTQNYISTDTLWSPVSALVFQTTLIPVLAEDTAAPVKYDSSNTAGGVNSSNDFSPIVTDIVVTNQTADQGYNGFVNYSPEGEYRLSCLSNSPQPISSIDISVKWRDRVTNKLFDIPMFNRSNVSLKIMFRRRDYMNESLSDFN